MVGIGAAVSDAAIDTALGNLTAALATHYQADDNTAAALASAEAHVADLQDVNGKLVQKVSDLTTANVILDQTVNELRVEIADLKRQLNPAPTFGVASHQLTFRQSVYGNDAKVKAAVLEVGASYIRDLLPMGVDTTNIIRDYADQGITHHLTVGRWVDVKGYDFPKAMTRLRSVKDAVTEVAGVNEPDGDGRARQTWLPVVTAHQAKLYDAVKGDPETAHIAVGLGALRWVSKTMFDDLRAMCEACAGKFDFVNLHFYPGRGSDVAAELAAAVAKIRAFSDKPIIISEGGASSANMTLEEQARICADLVQAGHDQGVKVYLYELMDDPDTSGRDLQSNFGLVESDFTDKPAAQAVRAIVAPA